MSPSDCAGETHSNKPATKDNFKEGVKINLSRVQDGGLTLSCPWAGKDGGCDNVLPGGQTQAVMEV
jgi:hypothetical protein